MSLSSPTHETTRATDASDSALLSHRSQTVSVHQSLGLPAHCLMGCHKQASLRSPDCARLLLPRLCETVAIVLSDRAPRRFICNLSVRGATSYASEGLSRLSHHHFFTSALTDNTCVPTLDTHNWRSNRRLVGVSCGYVLVFVVGCLWWLLLCVVYVCVCLLFVVCVVCLFVCFRRRLTQKPCGCPHNYTIYLSESPKKAVA